MRESFIALVVIKNNCYVVGSFLHLAQSGRCRLDWPPPHKEVFFSSIHSTTCDHCVALHLLTVHCPHAHTERKREREKGKLKKPCISCIVFFFSFFGGMDHLSPSIMKVVHLLFQSSTRTRILNGT